MDTDHHCDDCEISSRVLEFFHGDTEKTALWLVTVNPNFGNVSPLYLIRNGQAHMVVAFVRDAMEANAAAERARQECELLCAWKGGHPCLCDDCPRRNTAERAERLKSLDELAKQAQELGMGYGEGEQ